MQGWSDNGFAPVRDAVVHVTSGHGTARDLFYADQFGGVRMIPVTTIVAAELR